MATSSGVPRPTPAARGTVFYERRLRPLVPEQVGMLHQWPITLVMVSVVYLAFAGGYWDIGWHIDKGRDTLLAPPHVFILTGLGTVAAGLALFGAMAAVATREGRPVAMPMRRWRTIDYAPLTLIALVMLIVPQLAFGLDELWHRTYGLDVSLWSPPHLLIIVGGIAALFALAAIIASEANAADPSRRSAVLRPLRGITRGELLVAGAMGGMTLVLLGVLAEYDFDIPQWSPALAPPLMAALTAFPAFLALAVIGRRWSATIVLGIVTVARVGFVGANEALGVAPSDYVVLVVPALVLDAFVVATGGRLRGWPLMVALAVFPSLAVGAEALQQLTRSQDGWIVGLSPSVWVAVVAAGAAAGYLGLRAGRLLRPTEDVDRHIAEPVAAEARR